jgi:hypothetical protein
MGWGNVRGNPTSARAKAYRAASESALVPLRSQIERRPENFLGNFNRFDYFFCCDYCE